MALFHQIRRADPMEEARQKQEKFVNGLKNVDVDGTALQKALSSKAPRVRFSGDNAGHRRDQEAAQAVLDAVGFDAAKIRGRKPDPNAKQLLTLRLDPQVIEHFRATGDGWQTRMNEALRKAAGL